MQEKRCFSYWHQGWDNAPEVVKICAHSFKKFHPDWQFLQLDKYSVVQWLRHDEQLLQLLTSCGSAITYQQASDLIRMSLLEYYGGVWADATVLFVQSLNDWLLDYVQQGFFVFPFSKPGIYPVSNWFIYASADSPLVEQQNRLYRSSLLELLRTHQPKDIDYFLFHQVFAQNISDKAFANYWQRCRKFDSVDCSKFNYYTVDVELAQVLLGYCPLFKLNHCKGNIKKDVLQDEGLQYILQTKGLHLPQ